MEKERPFEKTKEFVKEVYKKAYKGELQFDETQIDFDKPYTQIGDNFYQADFKTTVMRAGDEIPLVVLPIDVRPDLLTPSSNRRPNAALLYVFAASKDPDEKYQTLESIGELYGVSRELIRQDVQKNLTDMHSSTVEYIQTMYPLKTLSVHRPNTISMRVKQSSKHLQEGIYILEISEMVRRGVPTDEMIQRYGSMRVGIARIKLTEWGMEAPERLTTHRDFGEITEKINNPKTSIEELRDLIREFHVHSLALWYSRGENKIILSISELMQEAWGNKNTRNVKKAYALLEKAGLPVHTFALSQTIKGKIYENRYYISLMRTKEQALQVLMDTSPENRHVPVVQVAGEDLGQKLPNTTLLFGTKKGEWILISRAINKPIRNIDNVLSRIASETPSLPVVLYEGSDGKRGLYVKKADSEAFKEWFEIKYS